MLLNFSIFFSICLFLNFSISGYPKTFLPISANNYPAPIAKAYYYKLSLTINPAEKSISGSNLIFLEFLKNSSLISVDLSPLLNVLKVSDQDGKKTYNYSRDTSGKITIKTDSVNKTGKKLILKIEYSGIPQISKMPPWDGGFVWSTDSLGRVFAGVACEGPGASLWWPCIDRWDYEPDSMTMEYKVPADLRCISNGKLLKEEQTEHQWTSYTWKVSYPVNLYDISFYLGNFSHFTLPDSGFSAVIIPADFYVLDYNLERAKKHFRQVNDILKTFTELFGPYPFPEDGYALVEAPYWGMEHQSAVAYGNNYRNQVLGYDFIILHETAHEWWGNNVSANDHGNMWIHEAFATYSEFLFFEKIYGWDKAISYLNTQKSKIENKSPVQGPIWVNFHDYKDTDMYYKGAWMIHTLRSVIADDSLFFSMVVNMNLQYSKQVISREMVVNYIYLWTGINLGPFFSQYLDQIQPPVLEYKISRDKGKNLIFYRWKAIKGFEMPLDIRIKGVTKRIYPTGSWQSLETDQEVKEPDFDSDRFYIKTQKITR
jgi:aminopeptidase N